MKYLILYVALLAIFSPTINSADYITADDYKGNKLIGFNLDKVSGNKPILYEKDFIDLANMGVSLVRITLELTQCVKCSYYTVLDKSWDYLDFVSKMSKKYGIKFVVAMQPRPMGKNSIYWGDVELKQSIINNWIEVAKKLKNNVGVAGFDLINEPVVTIGDRTDNSINSLWWKFMSRLIEAVRNVDKNHVLIIELTPFSRAAAFSKLIPFSYKNIVYSLHFYSPERFTHQGLHGFSKGLTYPNFRKNGKPRWHKDWLRKKLDPVIKFSKKYNVPIYVGEFGCIRWAPEDSCLNWIKDVSSIFIEQNWSWTFHSFRRWQGWDHEIIDMSNNKIRRKNTAIFIYLKHIFKNRQPVDN